MEENMEKIRVLFIQEKKIKKGKMITLGDLIENEVPDTYQVELIALVSAIELQCLTRVK